MRISRFIGGKATPWQQLLRTIVKYEHLMNYDSYYSLFNTGRLVHGFFCVLLLLGIGNLCQGDSL